MDDFLPGTEAENMRCEPRYDHRQGTMDAFFGGRLRVRQQRSGYRFSIDAVLLAHHVAPAPRDRILDLGTGCGIIPLILGYRHPGVRIYGVEVQPELAELAARNVSENRMQSRITILCMDLKALVPGTVAGEVDVVVCNPPYRAPGSGRMSPDPQRAIARHEIRASLADILKAARRMLRNGGKCVMIYPAERTADLLVTMRTEKLEPKSLRAVYSTRGAEARLILVTAAKHGRPGLRIQAPLTIYTRNGAYTGEVKRMLAP